MHADEVTRCAEGWDGGRERQRGMKLVSRGERVQAPWSVAHAGSREGGGRGGA